MSSAACCVKPAGEGVACLSGICQCDGCCSYIVGSRISTVGAAVQIIINVVSDCIPLGCMGYIFCRHGGRQSRAPAGEGVACLGWICRGCDRRVIILSNCSYTTAASTVKVNCILVDSPSCTKGLGSCGAQGDLGHLSSAACCVKPTCEGVACLSGICQCDGCCSYIVGGRVGDVICAAVQIISDAIARWRKHRFIVILYGSHIGNAAIACRCHSSST